MRSLQERSDPSRYGDGYAGAGEYYLDSTVAQEVYRRAEAAVARNAEVEIVRYAA